MASSTHDISGQNTPQKPMMHAGEMPSYGQYYSSTPTNNYQYSYPGFSQNRYPVMSPNGSFQPQYPPPSLSVECMLNEMNPKLAKLDLLDKVIDRLNTIENKIANFEQDLTQVKNRVSRSETNIDRVVQAKNVL
ncbi:hypothetical protein SNE40_009559 [Patella caerulea]|uniref:Uncharacterized protein n=1 Tax=Patella caerulea TaxID=87958 RepID=A0AAN8JNZ3_PATCE